MDNIDQTIIENIVSRMESARLNQRQLAKKANMDPVQLNRVLKAKKRAGRVSIAKIAAALGCSVDDLRKAPGPTSLSYVLRILLAYEKGSPEIRDAIDLAVEQFDHDQASARDAHTLSSPNPKET